MWNDTLVRYSAFRTVHCNIIRSTALSSSHWKSVLRTHLPGNHNGLDCPLNWLLFPEERRILPPVQQALHCSPSQIWANFLRNANPSGKLWQRICEPRYYLFPRSHSKSPKTSASVVCTYDLKQITSRGWMRRAEGRVWWRAFGKAYIWRLSID